MEFYDNSSDDQIDFIDDKIFDFDLTKKMRYNYRQQ